MSDPKSMLQEAEAALAQAEAQVAEWRDVVDALRKVVGTGSSARERAPHREPAQKRFARMSGPDAVETVLREAGEPLALKDIVARVQAGGFKPAAKPGKLYTTLYTNLGRQKRFKALGRARFALAGTDEAA